MTADTNMAEFGRDLSSVMDRFVDHPDAGMKKIGTVIVRGMGLQWSTRGSHWGTPWPVGGAQIQRIRKWQGYQYKPLLATGATRRSWKAQPASGGYKKGLVFGSTMAHTEKLHEGEGTTGRVKFQHPTTAAVRYGSFPKIQTYELVPEKHGFNADEKKDMIKAIKDDLLRQIKSGLGGYR